MTISLARWTEETVEAAGLQLHLVKGGTGEPLLILHDEMGYAGWLHFHAALAQQYALYVPMHPGFGVTERLDWIMNMRDMAGWYLEALDDLGLGPLHLLGYGLGGWLAAEMAAMCPQQFKKLVLVSAPGMRPPTGEIFDMFRVVTREYLATSFFDPENTAEYQELYGGELTTAQLDVWEYAREEASRLTWRPYMHYLGLAPLLHRLKRLPTLIVWGREDAIVPLSAGEAYRAAIPGSRLVVLDRCGHHPEMEQTEAFVQCVQDFLHEAQRSA
ncbi:2-hydroxy-6-oxo-6-phenylhexa-2,4-dienoate hydrolase [Candidatus Entotheonellaceae bacterium PAL068K]